MLAILGCLLIVVIVAALPALLVCWIWLDVQCAKWQARRERNRKECTT